MGDQRLTDKSFIDNIQDDDLFHIVDVSDTSFNPFGRSTRGSWLQIKTTIKQYLDQFNSQAPKTAGNGLNETATEYKAGDQTVDEDIEFVLLDSGDIRNPRYFMVKNPVVFKDPGSYYFQITDNGVNAKGFNGSFVYENVLSLKAEEVILGDSSSQPFTVKTIPGGAAVDNAIRAIHQVVQISGSNQLTLQPPNNDITPGAQLNFVLTKTSDSGASSWVDPNTLVSSEAFEQNVISDGTVFTITSATPITDIDVYIDQVRAYPSDYTINSTTNEITFTNTVFSGSIIHGRIYN